MTAARYGQIVMTSLAGQTVEALELAILDEQLKINERLPTEDELALQFGVSRSTMREALKRLAARHLIRSRRGPAGGTFVTGPSPDQLAQSGVVQNPPDPVGEVEATRSVTAPTDAERPPFPH